MHAAARVSCGLFYLVYTALLSQVVATKKEVKLRLTNEIHNNRCEKFILSKEGINSSMKMPSNIMAIKFPDLK